MKIISLVLMLGLMGCAEEVKKKTPKDYSGEDYISIRESCDKIAADLKSIETDFYFDYREQQYSCNVFLDRGRMPPITFWEDKLDTISWYLTLKQSK